MPLACGNTVVLKASELSPATHRLIGTAMRDAGFPDGVVNVVTNAPEDAGKVVETLISHPAVRRVSFTGSTGVGRLVAETAARYLKPILLELGGKAPLIVLDDADLDEAVAAAAFGAFVNQGQVCMSTERIVVDASVADAFVAKFTAQGALADRRRSARRRRRARLAGQPRGGDARARADRRCAGQGRAHGRGRRGPRHGDGGDRARSRDAGDAHLRRGNVRAGGGRCCAPRMSTMRCASPTIPNTGLPPPCSAATWRARSRSPSASIAASAISIRRPSTTSRRLPFGGTKASGYGRFGGKAAIDAFTELRGSRSRPSRRPIRSEWTPSSSPPCCSPPPATPAGTPPSSAGSIRSIVTVLISVGAAMVAAACCAVRRTAGAGGLAVRDRLGRSSTSSISRR